MLYSVVSLWFVFHLLILKELTEDHNNTLCMQILVTGNILFEKGVVYNFDICLIAKRQSIGG